MTRTFTSLLALSAAISQFSATVFAQGSLTPPVGPPVASMKTLDEIESRTAIAKSPTTPIAGPHITITQPGSYYLTGNITITTGDAIRIQSNNVTLDLNGYTIKSTSASPVGIAISILASDVTVTNGHISGPGFDSGISAGPTYGNMMARDISVKAVRLGIYFETEDAACIESCVVKSVTAFGLRAKIVKSSRAVDCLLFGIAGSVISDCSAVVNASATSLSAAIFGDSVSNCMGENNSIAGDAIKAKTAANCVGIAKAGTGIDSSVASHCSGTSDSGDGVYALSMSNCYGFSASGTPLTAGVAGTISFSHASRGTPGVGIQANNAIGCTVQGTAVTVSAPNKSLGTP